ncbi:MAG: hypothetical protein ING59_14010 [Burkholderiales bacterium]|nr:hypothetical protein [Burkholderiales bacterium]
MERRSFLKATPVACAIPIGLAGCAGSRTIIKARHEDKSGRKTELEIIFEQMQKEQQNLLDWLLPRSHVATDGSGFNVWAFDATQVIVDCSQSNVALDAPTGNFAVTLFRNGLILASNTFQWIRSGQSLLPANPAQINSWVRQYPTVNHYTALATGVVVNDVHGVNVVAATTRYSSTALSTGSTSYFRDFHSAPPPNLW